MWKAYSLDPLLRRVFLEVCSVHLVLKMHVGRHGVCLGFLCMWVLGFMQSFMETKLDHKVHEAYKQEHLTLKPPGSVKAGF